ncbi:MAG: BatA domain-containing protein, partial [Kiritimatiellaeota bacterium]|nr:BatA domain-containing protein [Kiritimatiellota bacterium]
MEFFSPWMLLGLAAVAVPVLIHLFNRKSAKTVNWGAFIFLLDSMVSRRRRMLIEEMLLLATRCLLLALLALALARPFIQAASRVPWVVVLPMMLLAVTFFGVSFAMWRYPKWRRGLFALSVLLAAIAGGVVLLEHRLNLSRFGAGLQRDVVLVIDGSSSMTMRQGAESNFDRARTEAEAYIKGADRGTAFGILVGGPVAQVVMPAPSADRRELFSILDGLQPVQGTMDIMNTLSAAAVMLASGNNPSKQIVIVGDGQAAGWHLTAPERWRAAREVLRGSGVQGSRDPGVKGSRGQGVQETATVDGNRMQSNAIETLTPNPLNPLTPIVWRTLPLPPSVRNVGIADISLSREIVGTDREVGIRVTLANTGSEAVTPEAVVLEIRGQGVKGSRDSGSAALDGNRMQSNAIETLTPNPLNPLTPSLILTNRTVRQLEPGTSHTVTFQHQFTQAGAQPIRARVIANDDLPADDAMTHVVQVVEALRVLIVDGNPVPRPLDRASAYLALALRPEVQKSRNPEVENSPLLDSSTSELRDFLIDPEVVDLPAVARREGFTDCAAVILADVGALPEQAAERLARFVASGGGLLIAPGARAQTNFYNAWALDGERVTPLPLQAFALSPETNRPSLKPASFTYDALSSFRTGSDLASVSAMRHWRMGEGESRSIEVEKLKNGEVATSKLLDSSTSQLLNFSHVVASFDNDDPFLAVRRFGRGTVMLSAIPFDATVSALPSRGSFLPLVHEIVCHLANPSTADLNLLPREGATLHLAGGGMARNDPTAQGLQGVYYSGTDFTGRAFGRVDGAIDFSFDRTPPVARLDSDRFSVRWTGSLTSRHSEEHEIWLETNARATLRVNGRTAENRRYTLRAGQPNTILIEMA